MLFNRFTNDLIKFLVYFTRHRASQLEKNIIQVSGVSLSSWLFN